MFGKKVTPTGGVSESGVQSVLHSMELGAWALYIKGFLFVLLICALGLIYLIEQFRGLELPEAMDQAQVARNVARGEGFTTKFIRPFSAWKMREGSGDAKLKERHPDVFNPPLFVYTLATVFKCTGSNFEIKPVTNQLYTKFPPDTTVVCVCAFFFLASGALV